MSLARFHPEMRRQQITRGYDFVAFSLLWHRGLRCGISILRVRMTRRYTACEYLTRNRSCDWDWLLVCTNFGVAHQSVNDDAGRP